jgi:orotidine-5'-phosphate decarboxylase
MIRAASEASREAAAAAGTAPPTVLAVTILTSHDERDLEALGIAGPASAAVLRLAGIARDSGAGGAVCSPLVVAAVRREFPWGALVVPGIRPRGAAADDQARTATPFAAVAAGADRIVVGRPITRARDAAAAAEAIAAEIAAGAA